MRRGGRRSTGRSATRSASGSSSSSAKRRNTWSGSWRARPSASRRTCGRITGGQAADRRRDRSDRLLAGHQHVADALDPRGERVEPLDLTAHTPTTAQPTRGRPERGAAHDGAGSSQPDTSRTTAPATSAAPSCAARCLSARVPRTTRHTSRGGVAARTTPSTTRQRSADDHHVHGAHQASAGANAVGRSQRDAGAGDGAPTAALCCASRSCGVDAPHLGARPHRRVRRGRRSR